MSRGRRSRGFTLVEMLTVVSVAAILAMVAVPSFSRLIAGQRVKAAASNLRQALLVSRSEALKRNANVAVMPAASGQWAAGWNVVSPSSGAVLTAYPAARNLTISGPAAVTYESSGRLSAGTAATFRIASGSASDLRCVTINLTGMPTVRSSGC